MDFDGTVRFAYNLDGDNNTIAIDYDYRQVTEIHTACSTSWALQHNMYRIVTAAGNSTCFGQMLPRRRSQGLTLMEQV